MAAAVKNWKTTLAGLGAAMFYAATGSHDYKHILVACAIAALGYLAHDGQ